MSATVVYLVALLICASYAQDPSGNEDKISPEERALIHKFVMLSEYYMDDGAFLHEKLLPISLGGTQDMALMAKYWIAKDSLLIEMSENDLIEVARISRLHPEWTAVLKLATKEGLTEGRMLMYAFFLARVKFGHEDFNSQPEGARVFREFEYDYIRALPDNCLNAATFPEASVDLLPKFVKEELRVEQAELEKMRLQVHELLLLIRGLDLEKDVKDEGWRRTYATIRAQGKGMFGLTPEQFNWGICTAMSRTVSTGHPIKGSPKGEFRMVLMPFADMVMHSRNLSNVKVVYNSDSKKLQYYAAKDLVDGEPLFGVFPDHFRPDRFVWTHSFIDREPDGITPIIPPVPLNFPSVEGLDEEDLKKDVLRVLDRRRYFTSFVGPQPFDIALINFLISDSSTLRRKADLPRLRNLLDLDDRSGVFDFIDSFFTPTKQEISNAPKEERPFFYIGVECERAYFELPLDDKTEYTPRSLEDKASKLAASLNRAYLDLLMQCGRRWGNMDATIQRILKEAAQAEKEARANEL